MVRLEGGAFALESTADAFNLNFSVSVSLPFLMADSVAMKGSTAGISPGVTGKLKSLAKMSFFWEEQILHRRWDRIFMCVMCCNDI